MSIKNLGIIGGGQLGSMLASAANKLNVKTIPLNYLGYDLILLRYKSGIREIEFERIVKPFINKLIKTFVKIQYSINSVEYRVLIELNIFE